MKFTWLLSLFGFFGACLQSFGQVQPEDIIQSRIEFISEQMEEEDIDLTDLISVLNYYYEKPINLNATNAEELRSLMMLSDVQINDLLIHVKRFGKLITLYELQSLKYWDMNTIQLVLPFVTVDDKLLQRHLSFKEVMKFGKFDLFMRYQRTPQHKVGYDKVSLEDKKLSNKYYYGNPDKYYTRIRFSYQNNLSIGITAEKDPGEQFFKGAQKNGFDFYSFHLYYHGGKYLRTAVVGDYQVQIGQGLNLWTGYAFRKTADVANIKRSANPIKAYTSADEVRFLRGAAAVVGYKNWSLLLFGSHKKIDGRILFADTLSENDLSLIMSIDLTGMHRTTSEIAKRKSLGETIAGANVKYEQRNFSAGVAAVYQGYDKPFNRAVSVYNQFDFRGQHHVNISADYNYVWKNLNVFGEVSTAGYGGQFAVLQGAILAIDSRATLSAFYRNYSRGYSSFYNNAMGEWSGTKNEEGIYLGLSVKLTDAWRVNTYYDLFQRNWLSSSADAPSKGNEFLFQVNYKPNKKMEVYGRFRHQMKQINGTVLNGSIAKLENESVNNYRVNFSYQVTESIRLGSRVEFVTYHTASKGLNKGLLLQQDITFKPKNFPLDLTARFAMFNTDSYYARIYSFEANALYTYSIPSYYYQGSRAYLLLRYSFLKHFDLWIKYGQFLYTNKSIIGSGSEQINGNAKSDITIQLRYKF